MILSASSLVTAVQNVFEFFVAHGLAYPGLFLILLACGLGLPLPEEIPIILGAIIAQQGHTIWYWTLLTILAGVLAGDCVIYLIGYSSGEQIFQHRLTRKMLSPERLEQIQTYFHRHGLKLLFGARFVAGLRAPTFLTSGMLRIGLIRFMFIDLAAALVSIPTSFYIAYHVTGTLQEVIGQVHESLKPLIHWVLIPGLVVIVLIWIGLHYWHERRKRPAPPDTAEDELRADGQDDRADRGGVPPGPLVARAPGSPVLAPRAAEPERVVDPPSPPSPSRRSQRWVWITLAAGAIGLWSWAYFRTRKLRPPISDPADAV